MKKNQDRFSRYRLDDLNSPITSAMSGGNGARVSIISPVTG